MPWTPPHPPSRSRQARVVYWRRILEIPSSEPAAPLLQSMAAHRLLELGGLSEAEVEQLQALLQETDVSWSADCSRANNRLLVH